MLRVSISQDVVMESSQSPHLFVKTLLELSTFKRRFVFLFLGILYFINLSCTPRSRRVSIGTLEVFNTYVVKIQLYNIIAELNIYLHI